MKVSWQVTANSHLVQVEEDKPDNERGHYIHPELYGQPADRGISSLHFPEGIEVPLGTKNR